MLKIDFVSLFPSMVLDAIQYGVTGRAVKSGLVAYDAVDPRDFTYDNHKTVDDTAYGGGPGMVMKAQPVSEAIDSLGHQPGDEIIFVDPVGEVFNQSHAQELATKERLIFVCGRYEGIDERVRETYATRVYSLGDFILTGGELPALVMTDAIVRLIPGVLGSSGSLDQDSFSDGLLSAPQYTRPAEWRGMKVPDVLLQGHHAEIAKWRRQQSLLRTKKYRPDLFSPLGLSKEDENLLK